MYTIEYAEQVSLIFLVAYYANHFWHHLHIAVHRIRRELARTDCQKLHRGALSMMLGLLVLQGCMQVSPVVFYGLYLGTKIVG